MAFNTYPFLWQGAGWKVVASFEGNFPNRIKQLPLDRHFDINNVKRVSTMMLLGLKFKLYFVIFLRSNYFNFPYVVIDCVRS